MMLVLVAILMIVGPLAAILFFIAAPIAAGLMAHSAVEQHLEERAEQPVAEPEIRVPAPRIESGRVTA